MRMTAAMAAVAVMEKEGVTTAFGVPGAAINPLYAALRKRQSITHILARHVEGASHMAEGYTRAQHGNIGVCIGTSGPAGTDMITGLYSASADSIPILCITGQAPRARLYKEDFQAVDIESIAKPVTKWAVTVREPALVPRVFQQAFHVMRSGRPGPVLIDLPVDVQMAEIEFDIDTYEPLPVYQPRASRAQVEKALDDAERRRAPLIVAGGGIINADASDLLVEFAEITGVPVIPTLMGWGTIPDDHPLMAGMAGLQTSHRYGNATLLASDFVLGIGNRWANRHTGSTDVYTQGPQVRPRGHRADADRPRVQPGLRHRVRRQGRARAVRRGRARVARRRASCRTRSAWAAECAERKRTLLRRKPHFDEMPIKPQRVYEEMNKAFGRDTCYVTTIGLSQIAAAQFLHVYKPRQLDQCRPGRSARLDHSGGARRRRRQIPTREVVGISGDYDFQFLIEELAVGAQFNLPYLHVVVNNGYLGLIRQAQRGFDMDYNVQLSFDNINVRPELKGYGVDHVAVAQGLGCKAVRVTDPAKIQDAFTEARALMRKHRVPVVVEVMLEERDQHRDGCRDRQHQRVRAGRPRASRDAPTSVVE